MRVWKVTLSSNGRMNVYDSFDLTASTAAEACHKAKRLAVKDGSEKVYVSKVELISEPR